MNYSLLVFMVLDSQLAQFDFIKSPLIMRNTLNCPICDRLLQKKGVPFTIESIFDQWSKIHIFSKDVVLAHSTQGSFTSLYVCPNCLLEIYLPPIIGTEKFYKELQGDVTLNYYRDDKWDFKEALKYIADSDSIIEIGCGPGYFLEKVKPYVKKTCGIDSNNSALQFARNNGLEVYDLETDMKSFWSTFDVVFSFHVLEHVSDPVGFIRDISLYAKPGGKICISVPNQDGPIRNIPNSLQNMPPHHATHWRLKTLKKLAEKSNLRITKIAYEPLLLENHNYYSHYWISSIFSEGTKLSKIAKRGGSKILSLFFQLLIGLKFKSFLFLKGQAILIVMEKTGS